MMKNGRKPIPLLLRHLVKMHLLISYLLATHKLGASNTASDTEGWVNTMNRLQQFPETSFY